MGDIGVCLICAIIVFITVLSLIFGWLSYKTYKMKEKLYESERIVESIITLKKIARKLNAALKSHDIRLDNHLHEISDIKDRLDILESGHPDSDIDYAALDDQGEVVEVWFNGKKYVPEDKRDEDTVTFYADNKVVAETTRPEETRCCATCQHYRPESGFSTCDLRTWLHVTKQYATNAHSACNNYEKTYAATKGEVDCPYVQYKNMSGTGRAKEEAKYIIKPNYLASDDECDELLKCVERLNRIYDIGLMSLSEYGERLKELMQNDT